MLAQIASKLDRVSATMEGATTSNATCKNAGNEMPSHVESLDKPDLGASDLASSTTLEKRLVRKLDRTILPWIMLMYFLSYMDRYALS
jgi:hypothetical protein